MVVTTTTGRVIFNDILHPKMPFYNMALGQKQLQGIIADCYQILGRAETIALLDNMKDLGFRESTRSGLSFATDDLKTPASKDQILAETEKEVAKAAKLYQRGIITEQERYNKVLDFWTHARERITTEMMEQLRNDVRGRRGLPQPDLPDGRLGSPRRRRADPPARRDARPDGQALRQDHRDADQGQLPRRPERARVLLLHPRGPEGPGRHRARRRPTRATSPASSPTWPRTS